MAVAALPTNEAEHREGLPRYTMSSASPLDTMSIANASGTWTIPSECCCNACPHCNDTCGNKECRVCADKLKARGVTPNCEQNLLQQKYFTICEVRRHNHVGSAWIVAGNTIYDATSYIQSHPGGAQSILKKAGGVRDCSIDLKYHSSRGKKLWKKYEIGKLRQCCANGDPSDRHWWMFWK